MAEETLTSQGIPPAKVAEDVESNGVTIKTIEDNLCQIEKHKRKGDKTALDIEFLKLEKKFFDVKEGSHSAEKNYVADRKPSLIEHTDSNPEATRELLESQEKIKELEDELLRISSLLKEYESENTNLKDQHLLSNARHQENLKKQEKLGINHDKLLHQISETEERHNLQIATMENALQAQEEKNEELINVKEAYDGLGLELESSLKKVVELELDLQNSTDEAGKFKELHRQSGLLAVSETKKALEFERLLELAKFSAIEMENQMASLQVEVKFLYEKIAENQKLEETLKSTSAELSTIHRELELSKSQLQNVEQRLASKEAVISELTQELKLARNFGSKSEEDIASMKENLQEKVSNLEDMKLKLKEEVSEKEEVEEHLKSRETKIKIMQEELAKVNKEKEELENAVANIFHQHSLELEQLLQTSDSKAVDTGKKMSEIEPLLDAEKHRIKELEERISLLDKKCQKVEAEFLKSSKEVSELEAQLEVVQLNASNLEITLQASCEKEKELTEFLNLTAEENRNLKDVSKTSNDKLFEAENLLNILRNELNIAQQRLESIENDLEASGMREKETMEMLKLAEEQLEQQSKGLEKVTARNVELELSHENLTSDSELKLHEVVANFTNRESEAKSLLEKVKALEDQVSSNHEQLAEASEIYETAKKELDQILVKLASSENANEDLKSMILKAEGKADEYVSEKALLSETNAELNRKVRDLEEKSIARKEIEELTQQLASEGQTLQSLASCVMEENKLLHETHKCSQKDHLPLHGKKLSSQKELERDVSSKYSFVELEAKKKEILLLATQVKELERRLQLADAKSKEKDVGGATIEPKDETTKSQGMESFTSTPSKRKSKKKLDVNSAGAFSSDTQMQTPEVSPLLTFKFVFAVALVSVILGIVLGKRY